MNYILAEKCRLILSFLIQMIPFSKILEEDKYRKMLILVLRLYLIINVQAFVTNGGEINLIDYVCGIIQNDSNVFPLLN